MNLHFYHEKNDIVWSSISVEIECELWKRQPCSRGIETDKRQAISLKCQYCTSQDKSREDNSHARKDIADDLITPSYTCLSSSRSYFIREHNWL